MSDDPTDRLRRDQIPIRIIEIDAKDAEERILAVLQSKKGLRLPADRGVGRWAGGRPPEMHRINANQYLAQAHNAERELARMMAGVRLSETGEVLDEDGRGTGVWIDV